MDLDHPRQEKIKDWETHTHTQKKSILLDTNFQKWNISIKFKFSGRVIENESLCFIVAQHHVTSVIDTTMNSDSNLTWKKKVTKNQKRNRLQFHLGTRRDTVFFWRRRGPLSPYVKEVLFISFKFKFFQKGDTHQLMSLLPPPRHPRPSTRKRDGKKDNFTFIILFLTWHNF